MLSVATLLYSIVALAAPQPHSELSVQGCDLGEHYVFAEVDCQLEVENPKDTPVKLSDIGADLPGDSSALSTADVAAHSRTYIPVHVAFTSGTGLQRHLFHFRSDEASRPEIRVPVRGFGMSVLDEQPNLEFGVVDLVAPLPPQRQLTLKSQEVSDLTIRKVLYKPEWIDVSVDGLALTATIRRDAPLGLHDDFIKLGLSSPQQREAWILVTADLRGDVVPSANPLSMGMIRNSDDNEFRIVLNSRSDKPFKVGALELDHVEGSAKASDCVPAKPGCRWVTLQISKTQPMGSIKGNLFVTLPDSKQKLKISLRGLMVDKDFKAKPLELKNPEDGNHVSNAPKGTDLAAAIKGTIADAAEQDPAGQGPLLKWSVANGQLIHGFQVFRGSAEQGPFMLLTPKTLANAAEGGATQSYRFRDNTAESGKTYWYFIGIVYIDGHKQQLTSPQKVVAK